MGSNFANRYKLACEEFQRDNYYNVNISNEMIAYQKNDYVVTALTEQFTKLVDAMRQLNLTKNIDIFRAKETANILKTIDGIVLERFGIHIRHIPIKDSGYCVFVTFPKTYSVLSRDTADTYEQVLSLLRNYNGNMYNHVETVDDIKINEDTDIDSYYLQIYKNFANNIDKMDKYLRSHKVKIDLQNAKIYNLPTDIGLTVGADFNILVNKALLSPKELTAVFLHEIGHAFTHIEYLYRSTHNTSVLLDTLIDTIRNKNKPVKESLLLAYKAADDSVDLDKLKDKDTLSVSIAVFDAFVKKNTWIGDTRYSSIDSEQLADNFSGRFGLGPELATALDKCIQNYVKLARISYLGYSVLTIVITGALLAFLLVTGLGSILSFIAIPALIAFLNCLYIVYHIIFGINYGGITFENTYDDDRQRFARIKYEMIRILRSNDLPKDVIETNIAAIENIDRIMEKSPKPNAGVIDFIYRNLFSKGRRLAEFRDIEQLTEKLMENDLHVAGNKLKLNMDKR